VRKEEEMLHIVGVYGKFTGSCFISDMLFSAGKARDHLDMATGAKKLKTCMQSSNTFMELVVLLGTVKV